MEYYVCDFETTTAPDDCRVWAFACCNVYDVDELYYGIDIDSFITWIYTKCGSRLYFHNLGFDGAFIMDYLERTGWKWTDDNKSVENKTYNTLISDMNQLYSITLIFGRGKRVVIWDSLKVIPLSVREMARSYGLEEGKGELDYEEFRPVGHELTDLERDYIRRDVQVVANVLRMFLDKGLTKMTAGANALHDFKAIIGGDNAFRVIYPILSDTEDSFIRRAYRGGFTYAAPRYQGREVGEGIVLDVNSLYPSVMHCCDGQSMPYGVPVWFDGEPGEDERHPLWVACITLSFRVKPRHIPCLQLKGCPRFVSTQYVEESEGPVTIVVTNVDWELIKQQYDIWGVDFDGGYRFKASSNQFIKYVDKWTEEKINAAREGNRGKRQIAKLMLNSLYGKFATRRKLVSRKPVLRKDSDTVFYEDAVEDEKDGVYLPVGVFVTAWARFKTISACQSVYDRFLYADTDSMHLLGKEYPENIDIDEYKLGAWKVESEFSRAKFLRAKCYIESLEGEEGLTVHIAGMPENVRGQVNYDNFDLGAQYEGKLYQKRVPGGIVLEPGLMQLRK